MRSSLIIRARPDLRVVVGGWIDREEDGRVHVARIRAEVIDLFDVAVGGYSVGSRVIWEQGLRVTVREHVDCWMRDQFREGLGE